MKLRLIGLLALLSALVAPALALDIQATTVPGRAPSVLSNGEIAINRADKRLIFKNVDGSLGFGSLLNALPAGRKAVELEDGSDLKIFGRKLSDRATDNAVPAADFGMTCDGIAGTDQSSALISATNAAIVLGGRDVILPPGTCRLLKGINPPSKTRWISRSGTVLYLDPAMTPSATIGVGRGLSFQNVSDIYLEGITFQGAGSNTVCAGGVQRNLAFQSAVRVTMLGVTIQDFGTPACYQQGIIAFGGSDWLIDRSTVRRTSGDNVAFSDGVNNVEIRGSTFADSFGDSALVCTVGGSNHNYHDNNVYGVAGNVTPLVVMDRCSNWSVASNRIYGYANTSGNQTGQAIRVARYPVGSSSNTSHDFTIATNAITGTDTAISVEGAGKLQLGYTDQQGNAQPNVSVPNGGRFSITGNITVGSYRGIQIADSEVGTIAGNTLTGITDTGLLIIANSSGVGSGLLAVSGNVITAGNIGIRQLSAGGTLTPSAIGPNVVTAATPYLLSNSNNISAVTPYRTPATSSTPCNAGEVWGMDASYVYYCTSLNTLKRIPSQTF